MRGMRLPGMRLGRRGSGLGIGGILILLVLSFVFKQDFLSMFMGGGVDMTGGGDYSSAPVNSADDEELVQFISFVLDDAQDTWASILPKAGISYQRAKLVLFTDYVQSACGYAQAASGPFYCPGDQKIYIDLGFYNELRSRFDAPGDFAQAYVLAHEIGHHVQQQLGIDRKMRAAQRQNPSQANQFSVRMELQADCLAGVWANATSRRDQLSPGDLEEGMRAAAAVGDDRIQRMSGRGISPESFTHGTSEQRQQWFRRGYDQGSASACNTFD